MIGEEMDHERSPTSDEPPQKKQRVLACRRCRHRKQKCEDARPCTNCQKSGDECIPTEPAPRPHVETEYVKALEERIAELESQDNSNNSNNSNNRQNIDQASSSRHDGLSDSNGRLAHRPSFDQGHGPGQHRHGATASYGGHMGPAPRSKHSDLTESPSVTGGGSLASPRPRNVLQRTHSQQSPGAAFGLADDSDSGLDHLVYGLITSPETQHDEQNETYQSIHMGSPRDREHLTHSWIASMPREVEDVLLTAYQERIQAQYPFFHWNTFLAWHADWKTCPPSEVATRSWQGFFVNLVYATAELVLSSPRIDLSEARSLYKAGMALLPSVLKQPNPVLQVQAYLLMSVHALHRGSTSRILSLASTTMRYCVQQQFHLAETEPEPVTPAARLEIQVRRRCFWSTYNLERLVVTSFDLPPSVPDAMITSKLYGNINDEDIMVLAAQTPPDTDLPDSPTYTCVSSSLHIIQCRRIQSEILGYTLRWDYKKQLEGSLEWRIRILAELESYRSRVQNYSDPQAKGHTSQRWLAMIYHYALLMLYRPTKESVLGPAGDWSTQASSQACLIFRRSQIDRQVAQAWLGLLVQFQSGVTLLYCFWATPPEYRTDNYDSPDVSDALRACSNILAIMTDRWPKADCLRDVFELLAREVPLVDRPNRPPTRLSENSANTIRAKLPQVRALIVHRSILRMIEEMITEDFPRLNGASPPARPPSVVNMLTPTQRERTMASIANRPMVGAPQANLTFEMPFSTQPVYPMNNGATVDVSGLSAEELLAFPGMFEMEGWT